VGIETPNLILGGDKKKALSWLGFARQKLQQLKIIQSQSRIMDGIQGIKGIQGVRGVHGVSAIINKMYKPVWGTKVLIKSFDGHDYINIYVAQGEFCITSFKRQYPVEDRDYVNRWMNTDATSPDDPGWLSVNQVLFEATDVQGKKINSGKVSANHQLRRYIWDFGEGAWSGSEGSSVGKQDAATTTHEYSTIGNFNTTLHAWDVPEDSPNIGQFPTFSGDIRAYFKATPTILPGGFPAPRYYSNAAAWAAWDALPWALFDVVPNTESGIVSANYSVKIHPEQGGDDYYMYSAVRLERDINFSQAKTGKIIIIPNGTAVASTNLLGSLGWEFPGRYGAIKNIATGEVLGRSGSASFANKQPYADWSNMPREDIVVEYGDADGWTMLKDPKDFGGTADRTRHGWEMSARGFSLAQDGIYYKSYTCRAKKSGGKVEVIA
jgi:hypothetical protein